VVYVEPGKNGRPQRKKAALSELLARLRGAGMAVEAVETKRADPRELVLKATAQLQGQIELMAKLMGQLNDGNQVNVNVGTAVQVGSAGDNGSGWDLSALDDDELDTFERLLEKVTTKGVVGNGR
jgi:hypothetical protein